MATTYWDQVTIDGRDYLVIDTAMFRVPLDWDPSSNMFIAVASPTGGVGNFPALVKGDTGDVPTIDTTINLTALESDDPTVDSASWTEISTDTYQLSLALHKGAPGDIAPFDLMDGSDVEGTPVAGKILTVNATIDGFDYTSALVGDRYVPTAVSNTPSGQTAYTLCTIGVPAQDFAWRPIVSGQCVVTGTGADVRVDLIARLDSTAGNEVGRGFGVAGVNTAGIATVLSAGPPANSADAYDRIEASTSATIYIRAERQSGGDTFTTSSATSRFSVRVAPIPNTGEVEEGSGS